MKKIFLETEKHFNARKDLEIAKQMVSNKKLWRITAIQLCNTNNHIQATKEDHFTVNACSKELAIGIFKLKNMNWFITNIECETVVD